MSSGVVIQPLAAVGPPGSPRCDPAARPRDCINRRQPAPPAGDHFAASATTPSELSQLFWRRNSHLVPAEINPHHPLHDELLGWRWSGPSHLRRSASPDRILSLVAPSATPSRMATSREVMSCVVVIAVGARGPTTKAIDRDAGHAVVRSRSLKVYGPRMHRGWPSDRHWACVGRVPIPLRRMKPAQGPVAWRLS